VPINFCDKCFTINESVKIDGYTFERSVHENEQTHSGGRTPSLPET